MSDIKINFDGKQHDLDDFELGDLVWLEEFIGRPLSDGEALNSMKAAAGFVFLLKRREDPAYTVEQALKEKLSIVDSLEQEPEPKRPPKRAARAR